MNHDLKQVFPETIEVIPGVGHYSDAPIRALLATGEVVYSERPVSGVSGQFREGIVAYARYHHLSGKRIAIYRAGPDGREIVADKS